MDGMTILVVANDGIDHMTSLQVLANELQDRGHRVVFAVDIAAKGVITTYSDIADFERLSQSDLDCTDLDMTMFELTEIDLFHRFDLQVLRKKLKRITKRDYYFEKLLQRIKPDVIIVESSLCSPALTNCGIPWLWLNFGNPNRFINDDRLPPPGSGLTLKSPKERCDEFRDRRNYLLSELREELNRFCLLRGAPMLSKNILHPYSPYLNVYVYQKELDYDFGRSFPPKNWIRIESLLKSDDRPPELQLPDTFTKLPGKLIYLALDMYSGFDDKLMTRLANLFAQSENKFIASKELFRCDPLPDNIHTLDDLCPVDGIKAADLVITCGDTRTLAEILFYGKPLIIMPLFGEQLDNAQRVKNCGLGVVLEPYRCQLSTTYGSINAMLEDPLVRRILSNMSYKMQNSDEIKNLCALIEGLPHKDITSKD